MASTVEMRAILKDEISAGLKNIEAELKTLKATGEATASGVGAMAPAAKQASSGMSALAVAGKAFIGLQLAGYVKDVGVAVFKASAEMESLEKGLTAVMGSSTLAAEELEQLREVAKLPGLGYTEAIRMSTSLQASGMSAKLARDAIASFGNALATVGKGKADLDGVGLALSQIMSKGKISAEEINQIAERVPQIRKAMEAAFGTSNTDTLQKMKIDSETFIQGITAELGKLEKATGGAQNAAENFEDNWKILLATLGDASGFKAASTAFLNFLSDIAEGASVMLKKDALVETEKKWVEAYRKRSTHGRSVALNEIDSEKLIAGFRKATYDQQTAIMQGYYRDEKSLITTDVAVKLAAIYKLSEKEKEAADKKAAEEEKRRKKAEQDAQNPAKKKKAGQEDLGWNDPKRVEAAKSYAEKIMADEAKRRAQSAKEFQDARDADAKEEEKANKDHQKRVDEWNDAELKKAEKWREFELEREAMRDKEREELEQSMAARLGMHNATITSMLKGETEFSDGMRTMWDDTGTAIINKLLEVATTWIAQQAAMLAFSTGAKAVEVGTSVASGAAITAAYAPAAAAASVATFGGAAAAGSASMAATVPAMLAMFSYADRGSSTLTGHNPLIVGETRPEQFRKTVPGQIHNTTNNTYGSVNVTVQGGGDARAIAREIVRAQRDAATNNRGGSH